MKKATRPDDHCRPRKADDSKPATKTARAGTDLMTAGSLIRFEAKNIRDHFLPSAFAVMAKQYGLTLKRQNEHVWRVLLAFYNSKAYALNLSRLCGLCMDLHDDFLAALRRDWQPAMEVKHSMNGGNELFKQLRDRLTQED
ncbi:MAG TPA: hypothetical protein ENH72_00395 [Pseudomonas sabulinigri]|uniref:DUF7673 domain-containing protein n=1 Tax=marine sediment metagenome TaxID=412755 RepID=A0A0F9VSD3_9ZZZZ|nr:hypothetical protein [Halopseudomonas sabulinigri]HEC51965.1 hypothetical protein [Halopseudomonas sabulinigri]